MLAKKTSKNQVTLPKKIVQALPETDYFDVTVGSGCIMLRPVTITEPGNKLATVRLKIRKLGLTAKNIDDAMRWVRARRRS